MGEPTRGQWTAKDTSEVLVEAGRYCLCRAALRGSGELDINDVLDEAQRVWARRFEAAPLRSFTRGAITSRWSSVDDFQMHVIVDWFEQGEFVRTPATESLSHEIFYCSKIEKDKARRSAVKVALGRFVKSAVLADSDRVMWILRLEALRSHRRPVVQAMIQSGYAQRRRALLPVYQAAIRMSGWDISAKNLLDAHLAIIDGALLQLATNRSKRDALVAEHAGDSAELICKGLPKTKAKIDSRSLEQLVKGLELIDSRSSSFR